MKFVDADLKDEVEELVLEAFREQLDENGHRREPPPYPHRPKEPDRIDLALMEASKNVDPVKAGRELLNRITEVLEDADSIFEPWEKVRAASLCLGLLRMDQDRTFAALRAETELARVEATALASMPAEPSITIAQAVELAKNELKAQTADA